MNGIRAKIGSVALLALLTGLGLSGGTRAQTVSYIHTDALGSVVATTNAAGAVIGTAREYEPYGYQMTPVIQDGPGYTGHVQDAATGLTYMQQRYYDPQLGVFLSTDPVQARANTLANFNRYRYGNSNPYRFVDPDGRDGRKNECNTGSRVSTSCGGVTVIEINPTPEQKDKLKTLTYSEVHTGNEFMESWFTLDGNANVTKKSQAGCIGDDICSISPKDIPPGTKIFAHVHVYPQSNSRFGVSRKTKLSREFPGPGDGDVVSKGYIGAVFMPSGARYILNGNPPRAIYLGGGDPAFGEFVEKNWVPGMTSNEIGKKVNEFLKATK